MKKLILIALALFISACDTYPVPKVEDNAIELDPKLADAYVNRGLAYARGKGWYDRLSLILPRP